MHIESVQHMVLEYLCIWGQVHESFEKVMMKRIAEGATRIFLACGATDFRKQIPGLAAADN